MTVYKLTLLNPTMECFCQDGFTLENMKEAMLQKVGLNELPRIHKRDLENLVIPQHIKNKYVSLLKLQNKRRRRSLPSLAGILRGIPGNADVSGEVMYSDTHRQRLVFDMETRIPEHSEVTMAELKLFKTAPKKHPKPENKNRRPVNNARVSIYWVNVLEDGSNHTSLVDSRLVPIHETGWKSFDVTQAVHFWSKTQRNRPMHLEVWVEAERPGSYAAELAKCVRFATQSPNDMDAGKPEVVLYTLNIEEFGSRGDCSAGKSNVCCREEHFVNFRELTWTQYWIIEPAGYQAYRCAGGCKKPNRNYGYRERTCAVVESAPLPMMYLVKKGDYTEIEVAEFPNMIVEKCGCTMDDMSVV
ncbi:left-right determination factor 2-like isoform X2 [Paramormyrops kingsleyae]|uniref:left-right determination factor 2-like isoform X2 n=1 Tax=Paramormyrops kingsleyae TaxID=1676925 RepID=UPI000CD5D702|nr:left-right determination factor 2-like isoform X2 [Paramormyrops kingsleyae]